ncbi:MAG: adenosine deaminase [Candidatus Palauibacterales bacterium]|nr:adenosine deaminase [Candidatus Palauibacterales bacterium]MDP2481846.1 adenosine deaminase [Candidatus Palauibacterales bacterium]
MDPATRGDLEAWLHGLPKAELHLHLDGSLRPSTILELAEDAGVSLPYADERSLYDYLFVQDGRDLVDYLKRFELTLSVMQTAESLERTAFELCEDAVSENVRYLEIRYSPVLHQQGDLSLEEAVEAPLRGVRRAEAELGVKAGLIVCAIRNFPPSTSVQLAELAVAFKGRGVVAFDLAGGEAGNPALDHVEAFRVALRGNLGVTIHAGEAAGADSIAQALHECGAHRIGHGTRLYEDPELLEYVADHQVPIEVCLTSNVQTHAVESFDDHPLRRYFDAGIPVSLHTDNRLMSGTTLTREYARAAEHQGFSEDGLVELVRNGFRSAFLPWRQKQDLLDRIDRELGSAGT